MAFSLFRKKKKGTDSKNNHTDLTSPDQHNKAPEPAAPEQEEGLEEKSVLKNTGPSGSEADSEGFFGRLRKGLSKTRKILNTDIQDLFAGKQVVDPEMLEQLEELLITADIGVQTSLDLIDLISKQSSQINSPEALIAALKKEIIDRLPPPAEPEEAELSKPHVVMVLGVNGVGKTTTIGKIAARAGRRGLSVLIAAADTFRAAAAEQLTVWAEKADAQLVRHKDGADPAAVAYDAIEAAVARDSDLVLVDTAGRLHTKTNLMEELKKIKRTIAKRLPGAPHEVLLVLDATTGQNALSQAQLFKDELDVSALALTKLDGTAKGGIVISICSTLNIPLKYIGIGEKIDDLQDFETERFVNALL